MYTAGSSQKAHLDPSTGINLNQINAQNPGASSNNPSQANSVANSVQNTKNSSSNNTTVANTSTAQNTSGGGTSLSTKPTTKVDDTIL